MLFQEHNENPNEIIVYKRASVGRVEYRSSDHRYDGRDTKSDDSHVYTWEDEFAQVKTIALLTDGELRRIFVILDILNTNAQITRYISRVDEGEPLLTLKTFDDIRSHAVLCETPVGAIVMPITNKWELD